MCCFYLSVCYSLTFQLQIHLLFASKEHREHIYTLWKAVHRAFIYKRWLRLNGVVKNGPLNLRWHSIFYSLLASNFVVLLCTSFRARQQPKEARL